MNKVVVSIAEAVADIHDGAVVLIGGFGGSGNPYSLTEALVRQGAKNLTIACNDWTQWAPLLENKQVRKLVSGFTNHPFRPEVAEISERAYEAGELELETAPHGTLSERMRCGKAGIPAFYVHTGAGTVVESGKEKRVFDGKEYILEHAIKGDFSLIKGHKADRWGNVVCRLAAGNRNIDMAGAARVTIAEVEEIVEVGELDPERIDIPGIFVDRVVQARKVWRWLAGHEIVGR
jgi:3-oxoacid CoA-transferase A subunit